MSKRRAPAGTPWCAPRPWAGLLASLLAGLLAWGTPTGAASPTPGELHHATWAKYQWFAGVRTAFSKTESPYKENPRPLDGVERQAFAREMVRNGVRTLFLFVGSFSKGGELPLWPVLEGSPFHPGETVVSPRGEIAQAAPAPGSVPNEPAAETPSPTITPNPIKELRAAFDGTGEKVRLLAWLGGRHTGYERGHVDLSDKATRAKIAQVAARLVGPEFGFDGVHLNIEPTLNEDEHLLKLLDEVRTALPPGKLLSFAGTMVMPVFASFPKLRERFWSPPYLKEVARRTDQIAFMTYDTAIGSPSIFRWFLREQAKTLARECWEANPRLEVYFGVPSYREDSRWHSSEAENVTTSTEALAEALSQMGPERRVVRGMAVYAAWTTSEEDWRIIDGAFSQGPPPPSPSN